MSREMKLRLRSVATITVILAMIFAFAISGVRLFGLQVYGVLTGSMEPSYPTGSLVYVKAVDPATLKVSDVITFSISRNVVATHRIVEKVQDPDNPYAYSFRTKGDANESVDNALVRQSNIIGKVVFNVPMMGYIASYIQNPPGTYVAIFISLILIAFVFMTDGLDEKPSDAGQKKAAFLPPAAQEKAVGLIAKYLPFLGQRKPESSGDPRRGYIPPQQPMQQQNPPSQQPYQAYPQQQYQPYQQQQRQYPLQQMPPQYPQQQYPQYPQQRGAYPPPQQQYPQYPPQYGQYPSHQPPQPQRTQQPYPQYPRQNPYDQQQPPQHWPPQGQAGPSWGQQNNTGYHQS